MEEDGDANPKIELRRLPQTEGPEEIVDKPEEAAMVEPEESRDFHEIHLI